MTTSYREVTQPRKLLSLDRLSMVGLITQYGLALIFAYVLVAKLGLPIPTGPALILAGALAADGEFSALAVFGVAFVACAISDATWYAAGRLYGRLLMKRLCPTSFSADSSMQQSEQRFRRWGGVTLALSKFIPGLAMVMPPLAGAMRLNGWAFAVLDGMGTALWAGAEISVGMLFHHEIGHLIVRLREFGTIAIGLIGMLLGGYISIKWWRRHLVEENEHRSLVTVTASAAGACACRHWRSRRVPRGR